MTKSSMTWTLLREAIGDNAFHLSEHDIRPRYMNRNQDQKLRIRRNGLTEDRPTPLRREMSFQESSFLILSSNTRERFHLGTVVCEIL
jgi:hypothetical protein